MSGRFSSKSAAPVRSNDRAGGSFAAMPSAPPGRALLGYAPQGPRNFGKRSAAEVYGATPSRAVKEIVALPKGHWGGDLLRGMGSPSGEPPEASWLNASKTGSTTNVDLEEAP